MKTNNNIPAYRFQGYTDAWELRKLGEVAEIITGTTPSTFDEENYGGKRLFVSPVDIQDNRYITETLTTLTEKGHLLGRELRPGATLFVSIGSTIGKVAQLKDFATSNQQINAVISGDKIDDDFIFTGLEKKSAQIKNLSSQQAVPIINKSTFSNIEFEFPTLPEQEVIGTFFSTLDCHITLHQRKLDTLKEQKKTYLKLLFPAKGLTKPALRFQGFEDDWKEVKLGEILKERNEQIAENEEYPLMSFVQGVGVTPKGERYDRSFLVKEDNKKYKKTELGDFIYSSNNLETGSIGFNKTGKAVISPVYSIFYSKDEFESSFIGILSQRKDFIAKMIKFRQGVVYGQWRIHENDFLQILLHIPTKAEMEKIITFFQTLDQEIAQVEDKLASLKEMKKTLLRKLFV
ncbi:TPA: restriction endonuclease subunit S [Streptococcus suis]|nr:restriction endonuclease subunit S [Streptococcus suis]